MRALRSTLLVRRVTPCGWRSPRRRRRFQSEKVENGLRHRRASARVRRIERLRRSRNLARHLKPSYRVKKARFEVGIARAQHARIVRFRVFIGREERRALRALRGENGIATEGPLGPTIGPNFRFLTFASLAFSSRISSFSSIARLTTPYQGSIYCVDESRGSKC